MNAQTAPRRLALFLLFALLPGLAFAMAPKPKPWPLLLLTRKEIPDDKNALAHWRPGLDALQPTDPHIVGLLHETLSPLVDRSSDDAALHTWLASLSEKLPAFTLRAGESFQLPRIAGPETPFPDHQPLRNLAVVRNAAMKSVWLAGRTDEAVALALENLHLSRTLLRAQEGIVPLLNASGIWQLSLDGAYWLSRQTNLTPAQAQRVQTALIADEGLAVEALTRAFRGEFTYFTRFVIDRMPITNDPELLLSSIGSLGMAPPEPPAVGEPRLAVAKKNPFDREATLQSSAEDIRVWLAALQNRRHPRNLEQTHGARYKETLAADIKALVRFSIQETPPTLEEIAQADTEIASADNPIGRLFLLITTTRWEPLSVSLFRREAERSALTALFAWRRAGKPEPFDQLVKTGLLPAPPADPFSNVALLFDVTSTTPRIWSVGGNGTNEGGAGVGENIGLPDDLTWPAR